MAGGFPTDLLELTCEAAFGADLTADPDTWTFTDLSARLLNTPITIRRGVTVGSQNNQISSATIGLTNDDGALTPMLVNSPYYPYVDSGTPIRLRLRSHPDPYLTDTYTRTVSNGWGTSDSGEVWTPVSTATAFATTGSLGQISHTAANTARQIRSTQTIRDVDLLFDVAVNAVATGVGHSIGPNLRTSGGGLYRLWPTVELGLAGAVGLRVRSYFNTTSASTTVDSVTVPALTYSAGTMIRCRIQVIGRHVRMRAWLAAGAEPSTWHLDATQSLITGRNGPVTPGTDVLGVQSTVFAGNTNTLPVVFSVDNLAVDQPPYDRIEGYIADVRPTFTPTGGTTWSSVQIDVGGIGSRLEKQQSPAYSPMRRSIQLATETPVAYWPLEDDDGATYGVSAFPGGARMTVTGPAVFSFGQGVPDDTYLSRFGTKPMVSLAAGARLDGTVPLSTVVSEWAVSVVAEFYKPDVTVVAEMRILEWVATGTHNRWALVATNTGYKVYAYSDAAGTATAVVTYASAAFINQATYTVEAHQNGGNVDVEFFVNDNSLGTGSIAGTLGPASSAAANPDRTNVTASLTPAGLKFIVGHIRFVDEISVLDTPRYTLPAGEGGATVSAVLAWYLEPAHRRLGRLCDEERIPFEFLGDPGVYGSTVLNAQQDGSFTELRDSAAESESGGLLWEAGFGYRYLPRAARYNQDAALTVDLSTYARSGDTAPGDVLVPQLDSRAANYWTVTRTNGGEGSYAADAAYRARRGTINEQITLDLLRDEDTDDHASWRVHTAVDALDANYPAVPVDLAANPALIDDWLDCDIGSRVQRTNQPTIAGLGVIDQVIDGYTETIAPDKWQVVASGVPAKVWDIAVVDDPVMGKADTDGSLVHATALAGASSIQVDVTAGPRWTTDPAQMPIPVTAGAVDMSVTSISGTSNPQTFTLATVLPADVAVNTPISLTNPARVAL